MANYVTVDGDRLDAAMLASANAIRAKTGGTAPLPWDMDKGYADAIAAITAGGDTSMEDGLLEGTVTDYSNARITTVGSAAFALNPAVETITLQNVVKVSSDAFYNCPSLQFVSLPSVNEISDGAFLGCGNLQAVDLGDVSYIGSYAFDGCSSLEKVIIRSVSQVPMIEGTTFQGTLLEWGDGSFYVPSAWYQAFYDAMMGGDPNWSYFSPQYQLKTIEELEAAGGAT